MRVGELLYQVDRTGITLTVKPGGLLNAKPTAALTPELIALLKEHKAEIIRILLEEAELERERERERRRLARAAHLGLVAKWSREFGYISLHDPATGTWHDIRTEDAPDWAKAEAFKRKQLYREGDRRAYALTASEMEELWEREHPPEPEGIVEETPLEDEEF